MTAIYDHLGNYLGDDGNPEMPTTSIDQMRYELSMMPLRPDGSDVPYTAQELRNMPVPARQPEPPRPYSTATNVAQAVADRLGLSAIPQAALGMASSFPAAIAKELGYPRVAEALQYTPSSRAGTDILEAAAAAPEAITGSHMGFGPLAEYWVPKSGFGLQSRPVISPSDVQVLGGRAIARGREVAAIPEDFRAAQAGLRRESDLGGPTYGARLQDVTEGLGDYLARQEAMRYSYEPSGSVQVFGNMVPETNLYAVRPSGTSNQVLREVPTPLNPRYNVSGESRLTGDLAEILDREEPTTNIEVGTRVQPFTNFVPNNFDKSANDLFRDFIMPKLALEFPGLQNENLLRAAQVKYGTGLQDWMKAQIEEFAQLPEVKAYNKAAIDTIENDYTLDDPAATLRDVMIVPPSVKLAGAQAAENWVMQNMQNYMTEYLGTEADPALQEVMKSGKTIVPQQELEHFANDNARTAQGFRTRAGLPTEGVVRPQLVNVSNERTNVEQRLEQIQNEFNALVAANPGTRPADIPGIKELYKEQKTLTKVKDKLEEQAANLKKAVMYEDYMDARVRPVGEKALVEDISPTELQRFPMIPTNKELMYQMYVPDAFKELGREIVNKLEAGLITPEAAKNLSVPTAAKMKAELTIKKEKLAQEAAKLEIEQLKSYIIQETQTLPQDGRYGKGVVVKFDDTLSKDQMERVLSSECEFMDHCIGRGGTPDDRVLSRKAKALGPSNVGSDDKYVGYIPMIAPHKPGRVVPKGSSGTATGYMKEFLEGKAVGRSFRDEATGVPFATMKLTRIEDGEHAGKYRMIEFYGYKDRQVDGPWYEGREGGYSVDEKKEYRQVIADWANDHADQLKPINNDHLYRFAQIYDGQSTDHKNVLAHVLGVKPEQVSDIVQQVGKRFVTEDEAKAAKNALKEAPTNELEALKETKADLERAIRNGNFIDDEEEAVLRGQLQDITDEIRGLQQRDQVVPQQIEQVREYMTWVNDRHPDAQDRLAQITEDLDDLSAGRMMPHQHGLRTMADTEMFIRALGDEQRRLLAEQGNQPARGDFVFDPDDMDNEISYELERVSNAYRGENMQRVRLDIDQIIDQGPTNYRDLMADLESLADSYARSGSADENQIVNYITSRLRRTERQLRQEFEAQAPQLPAPAAQVDDLDTELFSATNIIRENYNDTIANVVDSITDGVTNQVGSINDNPRLWIDTLRRDSLNYANRTREALDGLANTLETAYANQQPAQAPTTRPESINFLANDIVVPNAAFRNQTVEDIATSIRNQLLPTIERYNPTIPNDREALQRNLQFYQTSPLDADLGQGIEVYIRSNPGQENRIRESVADFMIQQIENRLGNRAPAPAQLPATTDAYATIRHANNDLIQAGYIGAIENVANNIMTNRNGIYAQLTDNERTALRAQLEEGIRYARARQEPTPLSDIIQMDMNRIVDNYDEEVYNTVDGTLSAINDNVDLDIDPESFIGRIRHHADVALRNNDTTLHSIYENLAQLLDRTLDENNAIYAARDAILIEQAPASTLASQFTAGMSRQDVRNRIEQILDDDQYEETELRELQGAINDRDNPAFSLRGQDFINELSDLFDYRLGTWEPAEDPGLALPVPAPAVATAEQQAMNEALQFPRFWQQRYPDLPQELISGILTRLHDNRDIEGLRENAQYREQGTIFAGIGLDTQNQAISLIDEIGNRYQNELQRLDNRPEGRKRGGLVESLTGVRSYSDLKREKFNRKYYDDGQAALDFELRHGVRSDQLGTVPLRKYSDLPPMQVPKSDEFLNFNQDLKRGGRIRRMNKGGKPNAPRKTPELDEKLNKIRELVNKPNRWDNFDDGNYLLERSNRLEVLPVPVFPKTPQEDVLNQSHMSMERYNPPVQYYSSGGINKVRPTPNIPATPAKQNPNTTDYVPNKTVDPGFKETLERIRKTSSSEPLHPLVEKGVAEGRINRADARWLSDYANTPGSSKVGTGSSAMPDQSQRMENFLNRVKSGEVQNPYPTEQRQPISKDLTGSSSYTREQLREQALRDSTLTPRGGGVSGGGSGLTDTELKNRLGSRNPTYRAGGSISIDEMKYALMKGR